MGLMMKTFNIFEVHWKIQFLRGEGGGVTKKQYRAGKCLKRGLGQFADLRGSWQDRGKWCFWGGCWYPNAHYAYIWWLPTIKEYDLYESFMIDLWQCLKLCKFTFSKLSFLTFLPVLILSIPSSEESIFSLPSSFPSYLVSISLVLTDGCWCKTKYHQTLFLWTFLKSGYCCP